jgi:hypothetical protein
MARNTTLVKLDLHCNSNKAGLCVSFILPFTCLRFSGSALFIEQGRQRRRLARQDAHLSGMPFCPSMSKNIIITTKDGQPLLQRIHVASKGKLLLSNKMLPKGTKIAKALYKTFAGKERHGAHV